MIAVALAAIYVGGVAVALLIALLGMLGMREWVAMFQPQRQTVIARLSMGMIGLLVLAGLIVSMPMVIALLAGFTVALYLVMQSLDRRRAGWLALGLGYLGLGCLALLHGRLSPDYGLGLTLYLVLAVWGTDIGAYFAGRALGGPKLCPRVSPSKTWSGLVGGMLAAAVLTVLLAHFWPMRAPWVAILLAAVLAVVAQGGDLFESLIKRRCGVKDSGQMIPGHGGVLDRIDGLIAAALFLMGFQWIIGEQIAWW